MNTFARHYTHCNALQQIQTGGAGGGGEFKGSQRAH